MTMEEARRFGRLVLTCSITASLLMLVALFVSSQIVSAHRPWFNLEGSQNPAEPYVLKDVTVSQVVYGGISEPGRVDYYLLTATEAFAADIQIVVPDVAKCAVFRPSFVIAGPGLDITGPLPKAIKFPEEWSSNSDIGWTIVKGDEWGLFFEPFTRSTYATSPRFVETLVGGDYLIAVVEPEGDAGTYGLALGGSERFGGDPDFLSLIGSIDSCEPPTIVASPAATPST